MEREKNKLLTRDNLSKPKKVDGPSCLFCKEPETINHIFFECVIAKRTWSILSKST